VRDALPAEDRLAGADRHLGVARAHAELAFEHVKDAEQFVGFDIVNYWHDAYLQANQLRHDFGPVALPTGNDIFTLFSDNVYSGGSLTLYALRQVVGEDTFRDIERTWVKRYSGQSVSTEQFIDHVNHIAHRDLTAFLRDWLYGDTVPPMPGHPDWTADPVMVAAPTTQAAPTPTARGLEQGIYKR
jgi:aminopeptidase N